MNPLEWFQKNVLNRGAAVAPKGGAIVPVKAGQLLNPSGIQQITTNLKVPGGGKLVGRGNAAAVGGALLETGLASMDNEYGRKVKAARDQREGSLDQLAEMGIGGVITSAFQPPKTSTNPFDGLAGEAVRGAMVVKGQDTSGIDAARSGKPVVRNGGGKYFKIATPEGQRG